MRVLFMGNMCNYAYWFAKWSRTLGVNAHALIEHDEPIYQPEAEDPSFDPRLDHEWLHRFRGGRDREVAYRGVPDSSVKVEIAKSDVVTTFSVSSAIAAAGCARRHFHHTVGSFAATSTYRQPKLRSTVSPTRLALTCRFRGAMRRARAILVSTPIEYHDVQRSDYGHKLAAIPMPYDVDGAPLPEESAHGSSSIIKMIVPSRHNWILKGQDLFFLALSKLPQRLRRQVRVQCLTWGPDVARSQQLVRDCGLTDVVEWSPRLPRFDLYELCSRPNTVVIGEFYRTAVTGAIGGVVRDGMACGATVVTGLDPQQSLLVHGSPPPLIATECDQLSIQRALQECIEMGPTERYRLGQKARRWMYTEHDYRSILPRYFATLGLDRSHDG